MARLKTYLINLDGSAARLAEATRLLAEIGLDFERVAAFDGRGRPATSLPNYAPDLARKYFGRTLSGGEIGCYLSHLRCVERFLTTDARYCLVLEDDLGTTPETGETLNALLTWLDQHPSEAWNLVNLGAPALRFFAPLVGLAEDNLLCRAYYFPVTTTAILWSRRGAEAFWREGQVISMPIDHFFRKWATDSGTGLAFRRALFPDRNVRSDINQNDERTKAKAHWGFWISRQRRLWTNKARAKRHLRENLKQT